jgi:electron transfer flavoprotein beta subunit
MNILVLLAGVVDPKWSLQVDAGGTIGTATPNTERRLGPFDESALELALKLRDERPDTRIDVVVCGGPEVDPVARSAAAYRAHRVCRLDCDPAELWDTRRVCVALMSVIDAPGSAPDLVLIGREFGDCDDGALPPFLAEAWGWRFVGMVQAVGIADDMFVLRRERGPIDESVHVPAPVLASITNDKSNRLRHPLLKNVMAAKQATTEVLPVRQGEDDAPSVGLAAAVQAVGSTRGAASCLRLSGGGAADIEALAQFLEPWRAVP